MAPEMIQHCSDSKPYTKAVDVYSFAMCLIELVHGTRPWQDVEGAPLRDQPAFLHDVATGKRPESQLAEATEPMKRLIRECWHEDPDTRPEFSDIVQDLTQMQRGGAGSAEPQPKPRHLPTSSDSETEDQPEPLFAQPEPEPEPEPEREPARERMEL